MRSIDSPYGIRARVQLKLRTLSLQSLIHSQANEIIESEIRVTFCANEMRRVNLIGFLSSHT